MRLFPLISVSLLFACSPNLCGSSEPAKVGNIAPPVAAKESLGPGFSQLNISDKEALQFRSELAVARDIGAESYISEKAGHLIAEVFDPKSETNQTGRPTDEYMQGRATFCAAADIAESQWTPANESALISNSGLFLRQALRRADDKMKMLEILKEDLAVGRAQDSMGLQTTADALMTRAEVYAVHVLIVEDAKAN